jgi:hypothetical protein
MSKKAEKIVNQYAKTIELEYPFIKCRLTRNKHIAVLLENIRSNKKIFVFTSCTPSDKNFSRVIARQFNEALVKLDVEKLRVKHDFKISYYAAQ